MTPWGQPEPLGDILGTTWVTPVTFGDPWRTSGGIWGHSEDPQ